MTEVSTTYFLLVTCVGLFIALGGMAFYLREERRLRTAEVLEGHRDRIRVEVARRREAELRKFFSEETGLRYEIRVADWGPDFTGEDDILPRWRWVVLDADHALKKFLRVETEMGTTESPFMLGNSPTQRQAHLDALAWVEQQENPVLVVEG